VLATLERDDTSAPPAQATTLVPGAEALKAVAVEQPSKYPFLQAADLEKFEDLLKVIGNLVIDDGDASDFAMAVAVLLGDLPTAALFGAAVMKLNDAVENVHRDPHDANAAEAVEVALVLPAVVDCVKRLAEDTAPLGTSNLIDGDVDVAASEWAALREAHPQVHAATYDKTRAKAGRLLQTLKILIQ
jgi:hypothetical protein